MNQHLQNILSIIQQDNNLSEEQKIAIVKSLNDADKELEIVSFKLDRTEKVKRTTAILLEETIEELEQKRKAVEAQNRELEIEAALERVRARSLAMHHTSELQDVVNIAAQQLLGIGMEINGGVFICINAEADQELSIWASGGMADYVQKVIVPVLNKPIFTTLRDAIKKGNNFLTEAYSDKEKRELFTHLFNYDPWRSLPQERKQELLAREGGFARSVVISQYTSISITNHHGKAFNEEENEILKRFGKVFEQSYMRFLDLQKAEAQAREAEIELALERVRSAAMAMRNSVEIKTLINYVYGELTRLDAKLDRCFFMIVNPENKGITWWMAGPEGLLDENGFFVQNNRHPSHQLYLKHCKNRTKKWQYLFEGKEKRDWDRFGFNKTELIRLPEQIKDFMASVKRVYLSGSSDSFGSLVTGSLEPLSDEHKDIISRFTTVFNQTYTRFLDLQKAEAQALQAEQDLIAIKEARRNAEEALTELKATQAQLIHAEKMASLGELTAGIAHEIQNPLNFVNNFAEVSIELIEEMNEKLTVDSWQLAVEISDDIKQNLEKINHHGKRADAIVKGMLHHSRTSTGQKEPTDINALADEYLRLAYHGLRAKDKSFNATMKTDFDESIGNINIIPQDIGRVLLNLINNAFYAVSDRNLSGSANLTGSEYKPTVTVTTRKTGQTVEISVKDNGPGIPEGIKDKIFQPFFTTKPTGEGTGLGLSMSYDIITKGHGGKISFNTSEEKGTEFILQIPN